MFLLEVTGEGARQASKGGVQPTNQLVLPRLSNVAETSKSWRGCEAWHWPCLKPGKSTEVIHRLGWPICLRWDCEKSMLQERADSEIGIPDSGPDVLKGSLSEAKDT